MVQIGEFERISQEKHWGIVAYKVPVACFCIEFHRESSDVTFSIGSAAFTCNRRETDEARGLLADFRKDGCSCILRDVIGDGERSECTCAFGMHSSFRNDLTVKVCKLLKKPWILQCYRASMPCCLRVLIVSYRTTILRCEPFLVVRFHNVKEFD